MATNVKLPEELTETSPGGVRRGGGGAAERALGAGGCRGGAAAQHLRFLCGHDLHDERLH